MLPLGAMKAIKKKMGTFLFTNCTTIHQNGIATLPCFFSVTLFSRPSLRYSRTGEYWLRLRPERPSRAILQRLRPTAGE